MKLSCEVNVHHLTRVEGHGNITISIKNGVVKKAQWEVVETPRFFEAMLVGKHWENAPYVCGRICGICSIGHTLASIRAVENAFGITPSAQTANLRLLLKHMETLQSHILHLYFLAAPDFLGVGSVLPLAKTHPEVVQRALRLKLLANDACDIIGGRRMHPTRTVVGGFTMLPEKDELEKIRQRLLDSIPDLLASAELFKNFVIPDFSRETEFVSLNGDTDYPFIGGGLVSTDGVVKKEHQYRAMTNEYCAEGFTSKLSKLSRASFAVGALARLNNNFSLLHPTAREISKSLGLVPVNHNPYMANVAQLVECVQVVLDSVRLIDTLLGSPWQELRQQVKAKQGEGVGAVEVPRGILYHYYKFDKQGRVIKADCVIPTSQNHANILHDIEALASQYARTGKKDREIELLAEMLVRAYDPCISCSVH
ncbi:MAG TPA: Ni/Fe hydrogenase subunit alpha [Desulfobulbaceae bacterium]|nr:MAG: hydrogenase [Deltaproteobacteria bacterium RIFOXYD12_FULL_53_23]HCC55566.1 Ni/Fe hydrogenase subunit alpha [Desulfobulbaceae bacterium]